MNRKQITDTWARHSAGDVLNAEQLRSIEQAMADDPILKAELADDQKLHRMLSAMGPIDQSRDEFTARVISACTGTDNPFAAPGRAPRMDARRWYSRPIVLLSAACGVFILMAGMFIIAFISLNKETQARHMAEEAMAVAEQQRQLAEAQAQQAQHRQRAENAAGASVVEFPVEAVASPVPVERPDESNSLRESVSIARVENPSDATWRQSHSGPNLPPGRYNLTNGSASLRMAGGSRIELEAPAAIELISATHLSLDDGRLTATVATNDIGFRITTPNSRVVDLGTEFSVSVDGAGQTDVQLVDGEVVVIPWQNGSGSERWHLKNGEFEQATVFAPLDPRRGPLASAISGPAGFRGQMRLAGESMEFSSSERFRRVRDSVAERFAEAPNEAIQGWLALTRTFDGTTGTVTMNGEDVPFDSLDSVMDIEDSLIDPKDNSNSVSPKKVNVFAGSIMINGQTRTFHSREEYEAFRKEMLQPLEQLGLRGPTATQRERDQKTNPFKP